MSLTSALDHGVEIALRLRRACEAHCPDICSHLDRVSRMAGELGRLVGVPKTELTELSYAATLHDIGKIGIPHELLNKPGDLTAAEMSVVKQHTVLGYRILEGSDWPVLQRAAQVALSHHECWDGRGYPQGLVGTQIPLEARLVSLADVYDALISPRAYKPVWTDEHAVAAMRELRGAKFDPELFDLFVAHRLKILASRPDTGPRGPE